jgi:hypothetical protein
LKYQYKLNSLIYFLLLGLLPISGMAQRGIWPIDTTKVIWNKTFDFEQGENLNTESIWQFGKPSKTKLNAAYSGNRALITDSVKSISGKRNDTYLLRFSQFRDSHAGNLHLGFRHKYDFDSLSGGLISISTDKGKTFYNVWSDTGYFASFWWYDNLYAKNSLLWNGQPGFKGSSTDWIYTQINFTFFILVKNEDSIYIRFDYVSDSMSTPHEGWLIDEIKIGGENRAGGIGDNALYSDIHVFPNPTNEQLFLENGAEPIRNFTRYTLFNPLGKEVQSGTLLPRQINTLNLEDLENGLYFLQLENSKGEIAIKKVMKY